jgi:hypothetical protein
MTYCFAVSLASLSRLTGFVSKEETRYYLNGVAVDFNAVEGARLVATNGHILGAYLDRLAASTGEVEGLPIIPRFVIEEGGKAATKALKPYTRAGLGAWVVIDYIDRTAQTCKIVAASTGLEALDSQIALWVSVEKANLIDGTFPDYHRVIPRIDQIVEPGASVMLNPAYSAAFSNATGSDAKTATSYGTSKSGVRILQTDAKGESPMLVLCSGAPDFIGVWVPCRAAPTAELIGNMRSVMASRKADESEAAQAA